MSAKSVAKMLSQKEDEEEKLTCSEYVAEQFQSYFEDNIPVEEIKNLPKKHMYIIGTLAYSISLAVYIYFLINNYQSNVTQQYISLDESSGNCENVPISRSNTYLADTSGNWLGSPSFAYSKAAYSLSLNNFIVDTQAQYTAMMAKFQTGLTRVGQESTQENVAFSLLYWMTYIDYYYVPDPTISNFHDVGYGQLQYIQLTGDPSVVFNLPTSQITLSNQNATCDLRSEASYDQANAMISTVYNATEFLYHSKCSDVIYPSEFSPSGYFDQKYTLTLDMRAFITALAVNQGILLIRNFGIGSASKYNIPVGDVTYSVGQYFDRRYPTMEPITCLRNVTAIPGDAAIQMTDICFLRKAVTVVALPVFHHYGASTEYPEECACDSPLGRSAKCTQFDLMSSLVFFKHDSQPTVSTAQTHFLWSLYRALDVLKKHSSYKTFQASAYNASFASASSVADNMTAEVKSEAWRLSSYDFCRLPSASQVYGPNTCSLMTFHQFSYTLFTVSNYHYQLFNGSCVNSISLSDSKWTKLEDNSPETISENYFKCYPTVQDSFINAIGVASGNTSIAILFFVLFILPLIFTLLACIGDLPEEEKYEQSELQTASDTLMTYLLRIRDGEDGEIKKHGVLWSLVEELRDVTTLYDKVSSEKVVASEVTAVELELVELGIKSGGNSPAVEAELELGVGNVNHKTPQPAAHKRHHKLSKRDKHLIKAQRLANAGLGGFIHPRKIAVFARPATSTKRGPSTADSFPYLYEISVNTDLQILNLLPVTKRDKKRGEGEVLVDEEVDDLVREIKECFESSSSVTPTGKNKSASTDSNDATSSTPRTARNTPLSGGASAKKSSKGDKLSLKVPESEGEGSEVVNSPKSNAAFKRGVKRSYDLYKVDLEALLSREDKYVLRELLTVLCLHASGKLAQPVSEIQRDDVLLRRIAYNIGGRVLTASDLQQLANAY